MLAADAGQNQLDAHELCHELCCTCHHTRLALSRENSHRLLYMSSICHHGSSCSSYGCNFLIVEPYYAQNVRTALKLPEKTSELFAKTVFVAMILSAGYKHAGAR